MFDKLFKKHAESLLAEAGICIKGARPFDILVGDQRLYRRVFMERSLGLGEAYMDGWWECEDLAQFFARIFETHPAISYGGLRGFVLQFLMKLFNMQSIKLSRRVAQKHYSLGNDLYASMLGETMAYTCAYYGKGAQTLDEAQRDKFRLVCRKLDLRKGQHVLDIGCGWGGFAKLAAEEFGVRVTAVNITDEQLEFSREKYWGLPVEFFNCDWRQIQSLPTKVYDHVVSIGMLEHVGPRHFVKLMKIVESVMKENGLFLLHSIVHRGFVDPWMEKYIFPGGVAPAMKQIIRSFKGILSIVDVHNFGADYARTLHAWHENFERAWPGLRATGKYDERFRRMWRYYLLSCEGAYLARQRLQLCQFVLSKGGAPGTYRPVR